MKILVGVTAMALLVGCSSHDAAAKTAFLKQAEAICAKANADRKALPIPLAQAQFSPYVMKVVAIADTAAIKLTALTAPAGDKKNLDDKVFIPLQAQLVIAHRYAAQVAAADRANDQRTLTRLAGNPPTDTKVDLRWMRSYGFKDCVTAADTSG